MLDFDPTLGWLALDQRLARTESPRQQKIIQTVIDHARAEYERDLDGLMATLVEDPQYHFWRSTGEDFGPKGYDAVRNYYAQYVAGGGAVISSPKDRVIVDDGSICTEGRLTTLGSGRIGKARGYHVDDESAHYLLGMRNTVLWSFDERGLAYGEDTYSTIDPDDFVKVAPADLPDYYVDYLRGLGREV
jgi:hypothetical protein